MTSTVQTLSTIIFGIALIHTFSVGFFIQLASRFESQTAKHKLLHLLGEVEIVFGFWAGVFVTLYALFFNPQEALQYLNQVDFTEPAFVFVIMAVAATRSIRQLAASGIQGLAKIIATTFKDINESMAFYIVALIFGPLLGSVITEPAAMTVTALILKKRFFQPSNNQRFKYSTLALLFVNVSIGGTLTHFAAPPVVMVSKVWGWDTSFMLTHFGWKALIAILLNTLITAYLLRAEFEKLPQPGDAKETHKTPIAITLIHILFIVAIVLSSHHLVVFLGLFLFFIGVMTITEPHQDSLQLKESILVGFFLAGLVVLGKPQEWWLSPLLSSLSDGTLFTGATLLTAVTDNAALTFLGAQVEGLSEMMKYALVAGAVTGGGLTVIANAPNPAGFGILKDTFEKQAVHPMTLLKAALFPTLIAYLCFWFL